MNESFGCDNTPQIIINMLEISKIALYTVLLLHIRYIMVLEDKLGITDASILAREEE